MKKRIIILLLISIFSLILASCNNGESQNEPKSLYELAVEAGFEGTLEEWCEAVANVNDTLEDENEPKSLYELAVEAGFEGTLEEWCEAVANVNDTLEDENEPKSLYELAVEAGFEGTLEEWSEAIANVEEPNITLADAIIIAQTHYFAVYYTDSSDNYMVDVAKLLKEDSENWYIKIAPRDVTDDGEIYFYKGQSHLYVISKETGVIIEIDSSGE